MINNRNKKLENINKNKKLDYEYLVVGSGPSGVSCAHALLKRGLRVTMIDSGIDLDSNKKKY